MRAWLKLIGTSERHAPDPWVFERKDLLREARFSERNPPDPISRGDTLVYHAVGWQRLIAIAEVLDDQPSLDPAPSEWEKQWPLILRVRPLLKVRRISDGPSTHVLGQLYDLAHKGFVPLKPDQLATAEKALREAGAT